MSVMEHWSTLPREFVEFPSLEILKNMMPNNGSSWLFRKRGAGPEDSLSDCRLLHICQNHERKLFYFCVNRKSLNTFPVPQKGRVVNQKERVGEKNYSKNILNIHFWSELPLFVFIIWTILLFYHCNCEFLTFTGLQQLLQFSQTFQITWGMYYTPSVFGLVASQVTDRTYMRYITAEACWHSDASLSQI